MVQTQLSQTREYMYTLMLFQVALCEDGAGTDTFALN